MPANYIDGSNALPQIFQKRMFRKWEKQKFNIVNCIKNKRIEVNRKFNPVMTFLFSNHIRKEEESGQFRPDIDNHFGVDSECNLCGTCVEICPVNNITMANEAIKWHNHCEKCLACIQWCPKEAIQFDEVTQKRKRYHHPDVTLEEMILKKRRMSK